MKKHSLAIAILMYGLSVMAQTDPNTAPKTPVDRFSAAAGHLMVRDGSNGLPAANAAINFDQGPFITKGKGPAGQFVQYYNFDVQPATPAPIYALFRTGETSPVTNQLNILNVKPGDAGYNDFWQVYKVTVPANYVANTLTSYQAILNAGYTIDATTMIVNCPIVPEGSTASKRLGSTDIGLTRGWYKDSVVYYFNFFEKTLMTDVNNKVPTSPIYVTFNINPGQPGGGPPSGFVTESGSDQTHNVTATIPSDATYSPLWSVNMYDNASFSTVMNLVTALAAPILVTNAALVNCPIISVNSSPTGIATTPQAGTLKIYPNPATDTFVLQMQTDAHADITVSVMNMLGKTLMSSNEKSNGSFQKRYDLTGFVPGIYFVNIQAGAQTFSQRILKN